MTEALSGVPKRTPYLHLKDGRPRAWRKAMQYSDTKACAHCGTTFCRPIKFSKAQWNKRNYCSISCSKKRENAMRDPTARDKMAATLRRIGHGPKMRGGNGRGMTKAQTALMAVLGSEWEAELAVPTQRKPPYPTHYKLDIANRRLRVAIEVDGNSHTGVRKAQDRRKEEHLRLQGWSVYRVSNSRALALSTISRSQDILAILQTDT